MTTQNGRSAAPFGQATMFIGAQVVHRYTDPALAPLVIGKDRLTHIEVARRTNLPAGRCARLITAIAAEHKATSIKDFYKRSAPGSVAVEHFGESTFLLLLKIFESEGLDIMSWARRGPSWQQDGKDNFSTFSTYKKREARATAVTRKAQRKQRPRGYAAPAMDREGAVVNG